MNQIAAAIVGASLILSGGYYFTARATVQRYQALPVSGGVVRLDAKTGELLACNPTAGCRIVFLPNGQLDFFDQIESEAGPAKNSN